MGKNYQGINGNFSGKIGPTVGRISKGRTITAIYQPEVRNPQTTKQQQVRSRFDLIVVFLRMFTGWARVMCKGLSRYGSTWNGLLKINMEDGNLECIAGTYPNYEVDASKIELSRGDLELPWNPSAVMDSNVLQCSWTDNSNIGQAKGTDHACLAAYNSAKNSVVYSLSAGDREESLASLTLPTAWAGDSVDVYLAFRNADDTLVSDSAYLGNISI